MSDSRDLSVSVVVEWENVAISDSQRVTLALRTLAQQIEGLEALAGTGGRYSFLRRIRYPIEVVVVFNEQLSLDDVKTRIHEAMAPHGNRISLHFHATPERRYYELKNAGGERSRGDLLVYLDSDVVPQPSWLGKLLCSFEDASVNIVGSGCYVEHRTTYQKSYAAIKFELPEADTSIALDYDHVHANSIAFRRWAFDRFRFPPSGHYHKLSIKYLFQRWRQEGFPVHVNFDARAEHPAPLPRNFLKRAFLHGRDEMLLRQDGFYREPDARAAASTPLWTSTEWKLASGKLSRILRLRTRWRIRRRELPFVLMFASGYYGAMLAGYLVTAAFPDFSRHSIDYLEVIS